MSCHTIPWGLAHIGFYFHNKLPAVLKIKAWSCLWSAIISHRFVLTLKFRPHKKCLRFALLGVLGCFNEVATLPLHFKTALLSPSDSIVNHSPICLRPSSGPDLYFEWFFSPYFEHCSRLCSILPRRRCLFVFLPFSALCKFTFPGHISPSSCLQTIFLRLYCTGLTSLLYLQKQQSISRS